MTNPVIAQIQGHASTRHYTSQSVAPDLLEEILAAAQKASTSSNLQTWSVIVVTAEDKRQELAHLCGGQAHIAQAPVFLAFCADRARLEQACRLAGYTQDASTLESFLVAALDASIAAQNAALAAESSGLGICFIGGIRNNPDEVIRLLGLPRLVFPVVGMTVGWPARPARPRPRLPLEAVVHQETYRPIPDKILLDYDRLMKATGIYKRRANNPSYGWLTYSARRANQPERPGLSESIKKQGFDLK